MVDIIILIILAFIIGSVIFYLMKEKKKGACMGCSCSKQCKGHCHK